MNRATVLSEKALDVHKDIDNIFDRKKIGARIKKYRERYTSFKQSDMAEMLHMSVGNYGKYERGCGGSGLETLFVISRILGMPMDLMLFDEEGGEKLINVNADEMGMISAFRTSSTKMQEAILFMLTRDKQ